MFQIIFLICLAVIWMVFAVVQDFKKREINNWLNFSLIIFAIGFRFFYCLFDSGSFAFFYQGLIGFGIFFIASNLLYYSRMFAGGDQKLLMALGAILPFYESFTSNLKLFALFFIIFFFSGAIYSLISLIIFVIKDFKKFKKEFKKQFHKNKKIILLAYVLVCVLAIASLFYSSLIYFAILSFFLIYLYLCAKSIDEVSMVKKVYPKDLTIGDWLYKDVKIGNKTIKKSWDGLSEKDIKILKKKKKKVPIRYGLPFSPTFLISFLILVYLLFSGKIANFI